MRSGVSTGPGQMAFVRTPLRPELDGQRAGEREEGALRRGVRVLGDRAAEDRHEAGDVDDRPGALFDHDRDGVLAAEEDAADVDGHDLVPRRDVGVDDRVVGLGHDPGVVVEDVDPAVRGDGLVDHRLGARLGRDVDLDEARLAAVLADEADRLLAGRLAELCDDDLRAFGGEHPGGHPAHPAAGAGDDADLVGQSH